MSKANNLMASIGLASMLTAAAGPAFAQTLPLVPAGSPAATRNPVPRQYTEELVHYIRTTLTPGMCGLSAGSCVARSAAGSLPFNAVITRVDMVLYQVWNSTTSDTISVGLTSANANELVATGVAVGAATPLGLITTTVAANNPALIGGSNPSATLTRSPGGGFDLWFKWTSTGATAATQGLVSVIVQYYAGNDGNCLPTGASQIATAINPPGC